MVNDLRRLLDIGAISPDDLQGVPQNILSQLMQQEQPMPEPRYDIAPMQLNTMRAENGPDAGKVTSLDFNRGQSMGGPQQSQQMQVIGTGNGTTVNLGAEAMNGRPNIDMTRPPVDVMGAKAYYSKDEPGVAYVMGPNPKKIILGYDMQGSMALNKSRLADDAVRTNMAHTEEQIAASQQARNTKEGIPGMGIPQSLLEKQFGKAPDGKRWTPTGELEDVPGSGGGKLTESQGKAAGLASRAEAAHQILTDLEGKGVLTPSLIKQGAESVPLVGGALSTAVNAMGVPSTAQNKVEQAQRDFVNAALRVESGASISQSEFDNARKQYFPQPGDSPEVIAQKQQAREREIRSLAIQAGPGAGTAGVSAKDPAKKSETLQTPPNAAQYAGKRMQAPDGTLYKSDGIRWVRVG
jgi:hypothetical protein